MTAKSPQGFTWCSPGGVQHHKAGTGAQLSGIGISSMWCEEKPEASSSPVPRQCRISSLLLAQW